MRACACWQHGTAQHQHTAPPPPCQDDDQPVAGKSHWPVTSVHPVEVHLADTVPTVKLSNPTHTVFVLEQIWPSAVLPHCAIHLSESSQGTFFMPLIVAQGGGGAALKQLPAMLTQPAVLQVALTKPSGVHASVVVQFDPTLVLPQMLFQAALLNEPGAVTGTLVGAMVHVSVQVSCPALTLQPVVVHSAEMVPRKPLLHAVVKTHVWPNLVALHSDLHVSRSRFGTSVMPLFVKHRSVADWKQPPARFVQLPSAPQVALTEPSGLQASVVLHLDPLGVLPQMLFHAKLLNWPGGLTGGFGGAMLHVSPQRSWPWITCHPAAKHTAETVPTKPPAHMVLVLEQVWPTAVLPHCAIHLALSSHGTASRPFVLAQGGVVGLREQPPEVLIQVPAALQVAVTLPSGVQASLVVQFDPLGVTPQICVQAAVIKVAPPLTGTLGGAPAQVLDLHSPLSCPQDPSAWQTAVKFPLKPCPHAAVVLQVCRWYLLLHAAAQAVGSSGAPSKINQPAAVLGGMGLDPQTAPVVPSMPGSIHFPVASHVALRLQIPSGHSSFA